MRFGLFGGPSRGAAPDGLGGSAGSEDAAAYRAYVEMVEEAEQLGFFGVYLVEHHFTGRGQISSSLTMLAHLAARTTSMRLGTAVVVVPWHNPLLLAEQAATIDVLSGGRLDLGLGRGYRDYEFSGFGVAPEEAATRFDEAIEVLRLAWGSDGRFSYHGAHWNFEDVVVEPRTVQQPHPPLWIGAGSMPSIERAAREGFRLFLDQVGSFELTAERVASYRAAREAAGLSYAPSDVAVTRALRIAHTSDDREQQVQRQMATLTTLAESSTATSADGRPANPFHSPSEARRETAEASAILGTPDECIERLRTLEAGGVEQVLFTAATVEDLRFFAAEVMPAFR
ncbi:MAG: LLM class flavin-dependent oxidoreductase [Chloroflexi bacterium]|nr:LLM class flavin-dependent oxidoreductase [Chloroflexota bacterium]MDA1145696.1 LLM class flavin-dependent oxidoreductase [Chloroflexota bacterium]